MPDRVTYRLEDGVARITMDDGKVNVMSTAMLRDLRAAFDEAERAGAIAVLRSARPGIFSAGFDLKVFAGSDLQASLEMVRAGAELALHLMSFPKPLVGVMEGHAFPMGTFLLLACDVRLGARGKHRMGLNEVAIGIAPPGFAIELARSRIHPAWLSRTVTLGEMFEPDDAVAAGFLDRAVPPDAVDASLEEILKMLRSLHMPSHALAKRRLRCASIEAIQAAIDTELTFGAYEANSQKRASIVLPKERTQPA
jgi:enoyl-CoA hydratase